MKVLFCLILSLFFFQPLLKGQEASELLIGELLTEVNPEDDYFEQALQIRAEFRKKYADAVSTCNKDTCVAYDYFLGISDWLFFAMDDKKTQAEWLKFYTKFYKDEFEYLEGQGLKLRAKVKVPYEGKMALWFHLWQASSFNPSGGMIDLSRLGCAQALLDHGISLDEKTGHKGELSSDFKGALSERLLGLVYDEFTDSYPDVPETSLLRGVFSRPELLNYTWKGQAYHMLLKNSESFDAFYILVQMGELGYDLTMGDCAKCKGMNSLMVYAFSGVYGFGSQGEYYDEEMLAHLSKYKGKFDIQDDKGNTALHYAVQNEAVWYVRALLELGADLNLKNKEGQTPLSMAYSTNEKIASGEVEDDYVLGEPSSKTDHVNEIIAALEAKGATR